MTVHHKVEDKGGEFFIWDLEAMIPQTCDWNPYTLDIKVCFVVYFGEISRLQFAIINLSIYSSNSYVLIKNYYWQYTTGQQGTNEYYDYKYFFN